jgi:hypothetical protein
MIVPSLPILGQGCTFALYVRALQAYRDSQSKWEAIERLRAQEEQLLVE